MYLDTGNDRPPIKNWLLSLRDYLKPKGFDDSSVEWLFNKHYRVYNVGGMLRSLQSQVEFSQGDPRSNDGWMSMNRDVYETVKSEKIESSIVSIPNTMMFGSIKTIDQWTEELDSINHPNGLKLVIPNVSTTAKLVNFLSFEMGLQSVHSITSIARVLAPTMDTNDETILKMKTKVLLPTSSTDHNGNVVAFKLYKTTPREVRSSIIDFVSVPKSTRFGAVLHVGLPQ